MFHVKMVSTHLLKIDEHHAAGNVEEHYPEDQDPRQPLEDVEDAEHEDAESADGLPLGDSPVGAFTDAC